MGSQRVYVEGVELKPMNMLRTAAGDEEAKERNEMFVIITLHRLQQTALKDLHKSR